MRAALPVRKVERLGGRVKGGRGEGGWFRARILRIAGVVYEILRKPRKTSNYSRWCKSDQRFRYLRYSVTEITRAGDRRKTINGAMTTRTTGVPIAWRKWVNRKSAALNLDNFFSSCSENSVYRYLSCTGKYRNKMRNISRDVQFSIISPQYFSTRNMIRGIDSC